MGMELRCHESKSHTDVSLTNVVFDASSIYVSCLMKFSLENCGSPLSVEGRWRRPRVGRSFFPLFRSQLFTQELCADTVGLFDLYQICSSSTA